MVIQGRWLKDSMMIIPGMSDPLVDKLSRFTPAITCLPELAEATKINRRQVVRTFESYMDRYLKFFTHLSNIPGQGGRKQSFVRG